MLLPDDHFFTWHPSCNIVGPTSAGECEGNDYFDKQGPGESPRLDQLRKLIVDKQSFAINGAQPIPIRLGPDLRSLDRPELRCETSGSSGAPKIIRRTHRSWIDSFEVNRRLFDLKETDVFAVFGSLAHSLTLYGVLEAAHIGADISALANLRPDRQLPWIDRLKASVLYLTPTQLGQLVDSRADSAPLSKVRQIFCGGGPPAPRLFERASRLFPKARITQFYGASETSFIAISDKDTPDNSVGRAYPGVTISIRGPDGQPSDLPGEIWVKSPYLFGGYAVGESSATKSQNDFLSIGESGRLDANGYLFIDGRLSRMVTIADQNVFPEEVEAFLAARMVANHVVVVPLFDAQRGSRLTAVTDAKPGDNDVEAILRSCRQSLGPLKAPRTLHFIDEMPMLPAGKPDLAAIQRWLEIPK